MVVAALLLGGPAAAHADTLVVSTHATTDTDDQQETTPTLGNDGLSNIVVYTHVPNGSVLGDMHYQRVTATGVPLGAAERVSSLATDDRLNDVNGSYIVYTALAPSDLSRGVIKLYDTRNGATVNLIPAADTVGEARIHDDVVAWVQGAEGATRIEMVDLDWPLLSSAQAMGAINGLDPTRFKNAQMRNALTNKIQAVLADIEAGDYSAALTKLSNDVLKKTDGCANGGSPDANDWIRDCAGQAEVHPVLQGVIGLLQALV